MRSSKSCNSEAAPKFRSRRYRFISTFYFTFTSISVAMSAFCKTEVFSNSTGLVLLNTPASLLLLLLLLQHLLHLSLMLLLQARRKDQVRYRFAVLYSYSSIHFLKLLYRFIDLNGESAFCQTRAYGISAGLEVLETREPSEERATGSAACWATSSALAICVLQDVVAVVVVGVQRRKKRRSSLTSMCSVVFVFSDTLLRFSISIIISQ
jgi:hypothetical protein